MWLGVGEGDGKNLGITLSSLPESLHHLSHGGEDSVGRRVHPEKTAHRFFFPLPTVGQGRGIQNLSVSKTQALLFLSLCLGLETREGRGVEVESLLLVHALSTSIHLLIHFFFYLYSWLGPRFPGIILRNLRSSPKIRHKVYHNVFHLYPSPPPFACLLDSFLEGHANRGGVPRLRGGKEEAWRSDPLSASS